MHTYAEDIYQRVIKCSFYISSFGLKCTIALAE